MATVPQTLATSAQPSATSAQPSSIFEVTLPDLLSLLQVILGVQLLLITTATLFFGILGILGIREWRRIHRLAAAAERSAQKAAKEAEVATQRRATIAEIADWLDGLQAYGKDAQARVLRVFDELDPVHLRGVIGAQPPPLPTYQQVEFEESDRRLLTLHTLHLITDRESAVRAFIKLSRFWRRRLDFVRSRNRILIASELSSDAHSELARTQLANTLAIWAGWLSRLERKGDDVSLLLPKNHTTSTLLYEAEAIAKEITRNRSNVGGDLCYLLGMIAFEKGDYQESLGHYRDAVNKPAATTEALLEVDKETIIYNYACCLSKVGDYNCAVDELKRLSGRGTHIAEAEDDPDFGELREHAEAGKLFQRLVEEDSRLRVAEHTAPPPEAEGKP